MSLAMYAAPFDDNNETLKSIETNNDSVISKKRNNNNKTQKHYQTVLNTEKVNSMLDIMHNSTNTESTNSLGDFKPLPPPSSVGVENTRIKEGMTSNDTPAYDTNTNIHETYMETPEDLRELNQNYMNKQSIKEYYQKYVPQYKHRPHMQEEIQTNSVLIDKLNYMIHLLEEQQDEKIGSVTEDVVLYSFLGIFIIFIVDSFARVGKYVR